MERSGVVTSAKQFGLGVAGLLLITNLRSSTSTTTELAEIIATLGEEFGNGAAQGNAAHVRVSLEGKPRELHPILRDDVYRIAREALRNAFHHAQASRIEVSPLV